jgi:hypothetical protein
MENIFRKITVVVVAGLLVVAMSDAAGAKPFRGGSCTSCHVNPGGDLTISPDPLEIGLNDAGLLTFDVTDLGGSNDTAISVQGLENVLLNTSIGVGGDNWTFEDGSLGMSYVSDFITALGPYTLDLGIGGLALPGSYPIVVMYVGDGQRGTETGFELVVTSPPLLTPGDGNGDGHVDGLDYLIWAGFFGDDPAQDPPGSPENGDFDNDNIVGGLDYLMWAGNFGMGPNDGLAVPEPSTCALAVFGLLGLGLGIRRRHNRS